MPGCGSCYHGGCNFNTICADYLKEHPDKCPGTAKPQRPEPDENNLPEPELNDSQVDNSQPIPEQPPNDIAQNPQPEIAKDNAQVPPPAESKKSCSAMMYSSRQTGFLALLAAFVMAILAYVYRRKCR